MIHMYTYLYGNALLYKVSAHFIYNSVYISIDLIAQY